MNIQSTFEAPITIKGEVKHITVRMQQVNPFVASDVVAMALTPAGGVLPGKLVKTAMESGVIISPKDLLEQVGECEEGGFDAVTKITSELTEFLKNPRIYEFKQQELRNKGKGNVKGMADNI